MRLHFLHVLSFISIFQALFLAFYFARNQKGRKTSNRVLAALLFLFAVLIFCSILLSLVVPPSLIKYQRYVFILSHAAFLIGPLYYFHIRSYLDQDFCFAPKHLFHFVPFAAAVLLMSFKIFHAPGFYLWSSQIRTWGSGAVLVQNLVYLAAAFSIMRSHGFTMAGILRASEESRKAWLRYIVIGFIVIWLVNLQTFIIFEMFRLHRLCPYTLSVYFLVFFFFINALLYLALVRPDLFSSARKYRNSRLSEENKKIYLEKLLVFMDYRKPYLEPSLNLTGLAKKLSLLPCHLSQIINESIETNFNDFINGYRIRESRRLLKDPGGKKSILEIAYDSGFNSKSAFNSAFKKYTGITPKEFKNGTPSHHSRDESNRKLQKCKNL